MGLISLPVMLRYGYDQRLATGVIRRLRHAGRQIIPPSLVLIVLADQLGRVGRRYVQGALLPGLVLMGRTFCSARNHDRKAAAAPDCRRSTRPARHSARGAAPGFHAPPLVLIFLYLYDFPRIATPTEGGALGAVGALVLAALHRRLNLTCSSRQGCTMKLTSFVVFS